MLILTVLAVFYTLSVASQIVLPFVLALVINLLLVGPMRVLSHRLRVPKPLAALVLMLGLAGVISAIGIAISVPAAGWISRAPEGLPALQAQLAVLREPLDAITNAYTHIQIILSGGNADPSSALAPGAGGDGLRRLGTTVFDHTRLLIGQLLTMLLMLFFLLTEGDSLLRRFVEIMPTFADKRRAVRIASQIERNVSLYLATITIMNLLVGVFNLVQCWLVGMPNPLLWGVLAFLLNYIPIIGPLTGVVIYFFVGLFTFPSLFQSFAAPTIYLCIHMLEGEVITPMLLAKRFTLNPVLVMASLMFWDWLWGISGAFLSVPMLAVFKIICDHVEQLTPIGHILGGPVRPTTLRTLGRDYGAMDFGNNEDA
nr:AI-2E family transporter [Ameyamaea chiangmaiensis]